MALDLTRAIKNVPLETLKHHPKNPRIHDERNMQAIISSLSEFELMAPLVIWGRQNYIVVGNGRYEALKRMGKKIVPIVRADHLSEEQALAYMIADNRTTDLSSFDETILAQIMQGISYTNDSMLDATGFNQMEIEPLLTSDLPDLPDDFEGISAPDGVDDIEAKGDSDALGRIILVFSTPKEREAICKHLGLDPEQDVKQTFSFNEIPAISLPKKKIFVKRG